MATRRPTPQVERMIAILLFAGLAACTLAVLLARYGKRRVGPGPQRDSRPPLPRVVLRELTVELLEVRQLIAEHLPDRLRTLDRHRGFVAANKTASGEVPTDSDDERAEREDRWEGEGGVYHAPR
jgi:hypothetical protein